MKFIVIDLDGNKRFIRGLFFNLNPKDDNHFACFYGLLTLQRVRAECDSADMFGRMRPYRLVFVSEEAMDDPSKEVILRNPHRVLNPLLRESGWKPCGGRGLPHDYRPTFKMVPFGPRY